MSMLWLGVGLLLVVALVFIFIPVVLRLSRGELIREQSNVDIYKSQLEELEVEKSAGRVSDGDYDALIVEIKRNLLTDTKNASEQSESENADHFRVSLDSFQVRAVVESLMQYQQLDIKNAKLTGLEIMAQSLLDDWLHLARKMIQDLADEQQKSQ